jgi:hypothetical protein
MAAVAFWRTGLLLKLVARKLEGLVPAAPRPEKDQL